MDVNKIVIAPSIEQGITVNPVYNEHTKTLTLNILPMGQHPEKEIVDMSNSVNVTRNAIMEIKIK
jgi:hypothetical protein